MTAEGVRRASVRVPGSTSNLGSGFDCIGLAVDLWLTAYVRIGPGSGTVIRRAGKLADLTLGAEDDLLHEGFRAACAAAGNEGELRVEYEVSSDIPVARGLGSSAAAFVAGARLANEALALGLSPTRIADLCARAEGHPDNAAPAALGGAVLGVPILTRGYHYSKLAVHESIGFVFLVPGFEIRTAAARAVLPATLPHAVAVAAAGKCAALVQGLASGDGALLAAALDDVLHVPFRRALIPGYEAVEKAAGSSGAFGVTLSGSGSTLLAIGPRAACAAIGAAMRAAWAKGGVDSEVLVTRPVELMGSPA